MGLDSKEITEEVMDPANFLRAQGNLLKYKKEQIAQKAKEEKFKKEYTFEPDTKLTKNKVIPRHHPKTKINIGADDNGEGPVRTSISSITLDGIAKKKQTSSSQVANDDPFE